MRLTRRRFTASATACLASAQAHAAEGFHFKIGCNTPPTIR